jgi:PAS domain S-box-containing protein
MHGGSLWTDDLAREIFEGYPAPTLLVDDDVRLLLANRAARAMLGCEPDAAPVLRKSGGEALCCIHADGPGGCGGSEHCRDCVVRTSVGKALAQGAVHRTRTFMQLHRPGGVVEICVLVSAWPVGRGGSRRVLLSLENVSDVSLKEAFARAEQELERAHERAASLARFPEENPDPVLRIAADGTLAYANQAARSVLAGTGLTEGRPAPELLAGPARRALQDGRPHRAEVSSGGRVFALAFCPIGAEVNAYGQDVTETRRASARLAEEKERLAVTLASIGDAVIAADELARVTVLNRAAEQLTGWTAAEALGRPVGEVFHIVHEETRQPAPDPVERAMREGTVVGLANHTALVARDGSERPIADSAAPIRDADGHVVGAVLVFRDQTAERRAGQALRDSEARLRGLAEALPQLVWTADAAGKHDHFSQRWGSYTGQAPGTESWEAAVHPADRDRVAELWRQAVARGDEHEVEHRLRRADGEFRWFLRRAFPLRDGSGAVRRWFGTCTDVQELKVTQEALREADRRKDDFLATLSHELRNPLAPIRNGLQILDRASPHSEPAARAREVLHRQTRHLARLVDDLLDLSRISHGKIELRRELFDLREVVRQARDDFRPLFEQRGVALRFQEDAAPIWIDADPARIAQAIGNLLQNAAKFTPRGGTASLSTSAGEGRAEVRVRDDGAGMDPEQVGRMFDAFAQAERLPGAARGGLGLGLSIVKGVVELHGGSASGRSDGRGRGSEFLVSLPLASPPAAPAPAPAARPAPGARSRSVLIIEDNLDGGQSLADVLELEGHRVRLARDGCSGLALARELRPDAVVCDLGLPDLDGFQVARAIRADAGLRSTFLVALSGYAGPADRRQALEAGFDAHLGKPAPLEQLAELLAACRAPPS